jgi:histidinol dehydrogenase
MRIVYTHDRSFDAEITRIQNRGKTIDPEIAATVDEIVRDVATRGDRALFEYTEKFDGVALDERSVEVSEQEKASALEDIHAEDKELLERVARRIEDFHRKQSVNSWFTVDDDGVELGQVIRPLDRVGIYVPGGLASYPSTVLMAAVPARIAGVEEIILTTPAKGEHVNPLIIAAANAGGVSRIFKVGGAQAIAALAYGTESIPAVDKIVGPGNVYVSTAKKIVYGVVGIDMIAGPSEILIISDGTVKASVIAADLLSQAEHDEMASAILITPIKHCAVEVSSEVDSQLKNLKKNKIAAKAIERYGAVIVTEDMEEALAIANRFAPEHLELMVKDPKALLDKIKNAGAVFLGNNSPEVLGDYIAGPSHILPTGGTARFSSPLGVYDFIKRMSAISFPDQSLRKHGESARRFAEIEGLHAHGRSITERLKEDTAVNRS